MTLELFQQIFEKYSNLEFDENPSSGVRVVPCEWKEGRTERDRHNEVNILFSQLCERDQEMTPHKYYARKSLLKLNYCNTNTVPCVEGFELWQNTMKVHLPEK